MAPVSEEDQDLIDLRQVKDEFMREDAASPLSDDQRDSFTALEYYPRNPDLRLDLPLDAGVSDEEVTMDTSTGDRRSYRRAGKIHFAVNDQPVELTVYAGSDGSLFLPVRDATSGHETYGAGRYLEPDMIDDRTIHVDFNYLYNPYCAYNERWSCPLPPVENWIKAPLEAGEKLFPH